MHSAAVRPYFNAGVALVGASVIAVAPLAPAPPHISLPSVRSAEVALSAAAGPLDAYAQLLHDTFLNVGTLTHQTFQNGVAPLLQQVVVNQLTLVSGLAHAAQGSIAGVPPILAEAVGQIASGQIQDATETLGTGIVQTLLPLIVPLLQPINNLAAVGDQLQTIVALGGLAVLQPPLAALESTGQAIQGVVDAVSKGDLAGAVTAIVSVPAVMLNGVLNGYAPTATAGLLTPGLGTLSILVNIRDTILNAIKPTPVATSAVTQTATTAAKVVTLDVAPTDATTKKATAQTDSSSTTDSTAAEGKSTGAKDTGAASKDETTGKTTESTTPAAGATSSSTDAASDPAKDTTAKDDTAAKADSSSASDASGSASKADSDSAASDKTSESKASGGKTSESKASDAKKDADGKKAAKASHAKASHAKASKKK
jgi:hypothetical protein